MGGGGTPAPQVIGGPPIPVNPFTNSFPQAGPYQPPASVKGQGMFAGMPSLDEVFNRPMGGPSVFPPSQSFPQINPAANRPPMLTGQPVAVQPGVIPAQPQPGAPVPGGPGAIRPDPEAGGGA